jgi:hypothetical protein
MALLGRPARPERRSRPVVIVVAICRRAGTLRVGGPPTVGVGPPPLRVTLDAAARGGDGVTRRGRGVPTDHASGLSGNPSEASLLHRIRGHDWRIATPDFVRAK